MARESTEIHMARINWSSNLICLQNYGCTPKALVVFLIVVGCILVFAVTIIEHRSLRKFEPAYRHPPGKNKFAVAIATDVEDPTLNYGIVFDCGSSGSRVYVYVWPQHSGNSKELLKITPMLDKENKPVSKKITPGLSTYDENPADASSYLEPLLDYAAQHVPKEKHKETPLYILATAGMRMLKKSDQDAIMDDLRVDIPLKYDFLFSKDHVEVISGKQEGVFAWIAINYVLGRFEHAADDDPLVAVELPGSDPDKDGPHIRKRTVGMIDMGGGSVQIAFEVAKTVRFEPKEGLAKSLLAEFNLGCQTSDVDHNYRVYVTTFLGYGANAAMERYHEQLVENSKRNGSQVTKREGAILDPCRPLDIAQTIEVNETNYQVAGTGDYKTCQIHLQPLLNLSVPCVKDPCSMNGVYQPSISFYNSEFYGFSEFWYTMEDVLRLGGPYDYIKFEKAAKEYCSTKWSISWERYEKKMYPKADEQRFKTQCFKSAWLTTALHAGFKFPKTYKHLLSAQYVNGKDVQWTLGALLYRTRFLPLREIEKKQQFKPPWVKSHFSYSDYVFPVCLIVVLVAILLYCRRIRKMRQLEDTQVDHLNRVPSMSYFMTDPDQLESGITVQTWR